MADPLPPALVHHILEAQGETDAVLIGGQALLLWAEQLGLAPAGQGLSTDLDFLGGRDDAETLAQRLAARIYVPGLDDATPNTAKLAVDPSGLPGGYGKTVEIDYLHHLIGLGSEEIRASAKSLSVGGAVVKVMHPVHCLESRLFNYDRLPGRQRAHDHDQIRLAVEIARAYLKARLTEGRERELFRAAERLADIARSRPAVRLYWREDIDVLRAIPAECRAHEDFRKRRWPQLVASVEKAREGLKVL